VSECTRAPVIIARSSREHFLRFAELDDYDLDSTTRQ